MSKWPDRHRPPKSSMRLTQLVITLFPTPWQIKNVVSEHVSSLGRALTFPPEIPRCRWFRNLGSQKAPAIILAVKTVPKQHTQEMTRSVFLKLSLPVLTLALLAPMISGCKKDEIHPVMVPEVQVAAVEQRDVPVYREWVGTMEGEVNATISAQVSGYLLTRNYG